MALHENENGARARGSYEEETENELAKNAISHVMRRGECHSGDHLVEEILI